MDGRWDVHRPVTSTPPASTLGPFLPDPCLCGQLSPRRILTSVFSTRPLLFLVHMYSLSLPSHPHSATLHFSSTATAGLACASSACISLWSSSSNILNEPLLLQTGVYVFPFLFFCFSILHQSPRVLFDSVWRYYLKPARDNMLNRRERTLEPSNPNWYILTDSFHTSIYKDKEERISCFLSPVFFYLY